MRPSQIERPLLAGARTALLIPEHRSGRVAFGTRGSFFDETRRDVQAYLSDERVRSRGKKALYLKAGVQVMVLVSSWTLLVVQKPPLPWALLGLAGVTVGFTLVGFCVLHDANHGAFSSSQRLNHIYGWSSDVLIGFGSYAWRVKHNVAHHHYPNIDGYDDDIAQLPLARLAPSQPTRPWCKWQHIYIWGLYAFLVLRWHIGNDVSPFRHKRVAQSYLAPPRGWDLVGILVGRGLFIGWAFVIPMCIYPWWVVILGYLAVVMVSGVIMGVVFQLAHCVEEASFSTPEQIAETKTPWAVNEVQSTVDFCRGNKILTWLLGGLNYQIEHHLFPQIPHTHYPAIAGIVERNARKHDVRYTAQPSLRIALRSHHRHLRSMGREGIPVELEMG